MVSFASFFFWRYFRLVCCLAGALVVLAGCGQNAAGGAVSAGLGNGSAPKCDMQVSWAMGYSSLHELKTATDLDLAVEGTFTKILSTQGQFAPANGQDALLSTDFSFAVSKVLLDPHHTPGKVSTNLTIRQSGGRLGGTLHQVCDDPLFQTGEGTILFLHQFQPGHYSVMGGPSGRFEMRAGLVQPVNDEGVKLAKNLTSAQFYALLQQA